jgi:zinc transport system substrate-binding protein
MPILLWLFLVVAGGCDDGLAPPPTTTPAEPAGPVNITRVRVVATVYPLADVARTVGGGRVDLSWRIEFGHVIAGYEPSRGQVEDLFKAGAVLSGGTGEDFVTRYFTDGGFNDRRLIRLDAYVPEESRGGSQHWLDPRAVREAAGALATQLSILRPNARAEFADNAARLQKQIDTLIDDYDTRLSGLQGAIVASVGRDYSALARHVGFTLISVNDAPAVRLNDEQIRSVRSAIEKNKAVMLLVEADTPPNVLRNLQSQLPAPVVMIDSLGSSSAASGRDTYDKLMRFNFNQLYEGWRKAMGR